MNPKSLRCACLAAVIFCLAALASAAPFTSPHGYTITPPAGWRSNPDYQGNNDAVFSFDHPGAATGGLIPIVVITIVPAPPGMTMAALKSKLVSGFKKGPPQTVILSQTSSLIGGVPDLDTTFAATKQGGRFRCRMVYVLRNKSTYVITAAYPEKSHAQYDAPISQMLASFQWNS